MKSKFPNGKIQKIHGKCLVLRGNDIDTDRIIPARFLKCVSFQELGDQVFADDRLEAKGSHPFDIASNQESSILIVNKNFGCGSSREHAPQALMRWGIRGIIGESYAEIFYSNCLALGIPCAITPESSISQLQTIVEQNPKENWVLDLQKKLVKNTTQEIYLEIEAGPHQMLLSGNWDATSQLISQNEKINAMIKKLPYLNNFQN
tara:strand:+ start:435 stop:1049 length:615 start_codon:yes stop_codon:yes gene_type:complete